MNKLLLPSSLCFSLLSANPSLPIEWEAIELIGTSESFAEMREAQISRFLRISYSPDLEKVIVEPSGEEPWLPQILLLKIADEGLRERYTEMRDEGRTLIWRR